MHLRIVKAKSGKTVRRYAQLVESYRRDDGLPVHRVLASLGQLSDQEIANFRLALEASRNAKSVVLPEAPKWRAKVLANLAYLDVAVALEMWRGWELSELLHRLIPEREVAVRAAEVICALTIQRCVAPGSKLYAQRWFPRTALPELLGVAPAHFHNTRIHRVLDQLDRIESDLQDGLVRRYEQRDGTFATLFTDVTDAWFEGRGPDLAQRSRTKEGLHNRHKIGILLLCNEHGYPLRWSTLPGRTQDGKTLCDLVENIEDKEWAQGVPIVFDRAMGSAGAVARLCKSELRFVTAVRRSEIHSYTEDLPSETLCDLKGSEDEVERKRQIAEAGKRVSAAGMQKIDEQLYVLDLGITSRGLRLVSELEEPDVDADTLEGGALWLYRARGYRAQLEDKAFKTQSEIAKHLGVTRARMTQIMTLLRLDEALQKEVLAGTYGYIADRTLRAIATLRSKAAQRRALVEHGASSRPMDGSNKPQRFQHKSTLDVSLRLVLYFNPQMFVDMRAMGERHRAEIDAYVRDLNVRLRRRSNTVTRESVYADITGKLASHSMLSIYTVQIGEKDDAGHKHFVVSLAFDEAAWNTRRSTDGFVLLVAHTELPQSAAELVALYRAKDAVEKDFQTIKSDIEIRPVFHHTDPKVRAHVSLCMLALLLERTMERRLRNAGKAMTAPAVLEELAAGHLNRVATGPDDSIAYVATEPSVEQRELLARLRLEHLVDQEQIAARLEPRPDA
jgi:ParB-like chromosome segregation protein Spo0J